MEHYPVFLKLDDKKCLVVGGGSVAERKVKSLVRCGARVYVVSPELTPGLEEMARMGHIHHRAGYYNTGDLDGVFLVISATNDNSVNSIVAADCQARNIMINVVDDPEHCSFVVPSVVHRGSFKIAISTAGKSPHLSRVVREQLEKEFGAHFEEFVEFLGRIRERVLREIKDPDQRRKVLNNLVDQKTFEMLRRGEIESAKERVENVCNSSGSKP